MQNSNPIGIWLDLFEGFENFENLAQFRKTAWVSPSIIIIFLQKIIIKTQKHTTINVYKHALPPLVFFSLCKSCSLISYLLIGEKPFQCYLCTKAFSESCKLKRHLAKVHYIIKNGIWWMVIMHGFWELRSIISIFTITAYLLPYFPSSVLLCFSYIKVVLAFSRYLLPFNDPSINI